MKYFLVGLILIPHLLWGDNLRITLHSGKYKIETDKIVMAGFQYLLSPGKPMLPKKTFLIAIPPGAEVQNVQVSGSPVIIPGTYKIKPAPPYLPLSAQNWQQELLAEYHLNITETYSSDAPWPEQFWHYDGRSSLRKYNLVRIAFFPFAFRPASGELIYYPEAVASINYTFEPEAHQSQAEKLMDDKLLSDTIADRHAERIITNYETAKLWYQPKLKGSAKSEKGYNYVIVTTQACSTYVDTLVKWKQTIGYDVKVVTKNWIEENYTGIDTPQKIRRFLRDKYLNWGIKWVLIVGSTPTDIPMRMCCPWDNDPDSPWNDEGSSPIPTDLYYADLGLPDNLSWDSDEDGLFGEPNDDSPDYITEVSVGRIPFSDSARVVHICEKLVSFEMNTDPIYKNSSLSSPAFLWFDDPGTTWDERTDGAELTELLMNAGVYDRTLATTLYEKAGLDTSLYPCTAPITNENIKSYWSNVAIYNGVGHGWPYGFVRTLLGLPDELALYYTDTPELDDNHPAIAFLMSCSCGYPEVLSLGVSLLHQGCAGVVSASRVAFGATGWSDSLHGGSESYDYFFFSKLLKDTSISHAKVGAALDEARIAFYDVDYYPAAPGYCWTGIYEYNLYGEPSLMHFGATPGPRISTHPDTLVFDFTKAIYKNLTVKNIGVESLQVNNIEEQIPWVISVSPVEFSLAPSDSKNVYVGVDSSGVAPGIHLGALEISSNDPYRNPFFVPLKLVLPAPDIAVSPDTLKFEVTIKEAIETMWVKNAGQIMLTVSSINGTQTWISTITPDSFDIQPGDSQEVSVEINSEGLSEGTYCGSLLIYSNDPDKNIYYEPVILTVTSGIEEASQPAYKFELYLPFPNPVYKSARIIYTLPEKELVSLKIYDLSGRVVKTLFQGYGMMGHNQVKWDAEDTQGVLLPSGIYFCKLSTLNKSIVRKFVLIK